MIQLCEITRAFGKNKVLDKLSMDFHTGNIYSIIAPNGTGKTTLLSIIADLLIPDSGAIKYGEGFSCKDIMFLLAGEKNIYMKKTVFENTVLFGTLAGLRKSEVLSNIEKYKKVFPFYESSKDKLAESLSYGQKRMAALFTTVVAETKCVLIDEATEGLDIDNIELLRKTLSELKKDRIIILATQDLAFAAETSDKLLFLKNGKIINCSEKIDNREELIKEYSKLFGGA